MRRGNVPNRVRRFNPRAREGRDKWIDHLLSEANKFQSTRP